MQVWKVALVLNVALAVGLGLGYVGWGRHTEALERELEGLQARVERLERERQACAAGARAGEQQWEGRGIVRAVYPQLLVITHEEIRGLLSARTTGFPRSALTLRDHIQLGDAIRFSLRGTAADDVMLVGIASW
jgi:hypothetical protein